MSAKVIPVTTHSVVGQRIATSEREPLGSAEPTRLVEAGPSADGAMATENVSKGKPRPVSDSIALMMARTRAML